jgi:hypothetical protein
MPTPRCLRLSYYQTIPAGALVQGKAPLASAQQKSLPGSGRASARSDNKRPFVPPFDAPRFGRIRSFFRPKKVLVSGARDREINSMQRFVGGGRVPLGLVACAIGMGCEHVEEPFPTTPVSVKPRFIAGSQRPVDPASGTLYDGLHALALCGVRSCQDIAVATDGNLDFNGWESRFQGYRPPVFHRACSSLGGSAAAPGAPALTERGNDVVI